MTHDVGLFMQRTCDSKITPEDSPFPLPAPPRPLNPAIQAFLVDTYTWGMYWSSAGGAGSAMRPRNECLMPILVLL
jgi:hypothetical protein